MPWIKVRNDRDDRGRDDVADALLAASAQGIDLEVPVASYEAGTLEVTLNERQAQLIDLHLAVDKLRAQGYEVVFDARP